MKKTPTILLTSLMLLTGCAQSVKTENSEIPVLPYEIKLNTATTIKTDSNKEMFPQLTYLNQVTHSFENKKPPICQQISTIVESDMHSLEKELLDKEIVKNRVNMTINDNKKTEKLFKNLKTLMTKNKIGMVDKLCVQEKQIYFTLPSDDNYDSVIHISKWLDDKEDFVLLKGIEGTADLYYTFIPNFITGQHLVKTGYGDAGHLWWQFALLDEATQSYKTVEYCQGDSVYDEQKGEFSNEFEYKCEKEFRPLN